jgi:hypothetical protein
MNTKDLTKVGFEQVSGEDGDWGIIVDVEAFEGRGKTHFALHSPSPIGYINFDKGDRGVKEKAVRAGKEVWMVDLESPAGIITPINVSEKSDREREDLRQAARQVWYDRFIPAFETSLRECQTTVVDTADEIWELFRIASFGMISKTEHYYPPVNAEFEASVRDKADYAADHGRNTIYIHKLKTYEKRTYPLGFSKMPFIADVVVRPEKNEDGEFYLEVTKCRQRPGLEGVILEGQEAVMIDGEVEMIDQHSFAWLAAQVFPDTEPGEWM